MEGNSEVKLQLNNVLEKKLTAINQFFLHARMCKSWGLNKLNEYEYCYSIKLMKQADKIIERIFFLEGLPNLQSLGKLLIGENVSEIIFNDLTITTEIADTLRHCINLSESLQDYVSRDLLTNLLEETEEEIDWLESQHWLIANSGLENYLQSMI
ncbi:MAG: bacterioferritin [Cyanobacteria bacterium]|nr:bacterioferritin [Cyanobacteria bacterium CG_2015-16_32_12]NCO77261.1 bacterioferritin [Cyanobacteria bacterium CG_2015-22_32_23]NCQ05424.1 bacterioferritin [Cyanobacteria bacterium CG_2015-09_32_10]NCQ42704.1 bacterioferritin [Cyanobacteria bacterium CG_2015-04_32_10]NCS86123.1 bacterioferritin [Cyanobacteria bacterium CG_2015-02_32_10]